MYEKIRFITLGAAMIAGIGLGELGGLASVFAILALVILVISIWFIWRRVQELSEQTSTLSAGVNKLNVKVGNLEETMKPNPESG